jgi:hypothetical protein
MMGVANTRPGDRRVRVAVIVPVAALVASLGFAGVWRSIAPHGNGPGAAYTVAPARSDSAAPVESLSPLAPTAAMPDRSVRVVVVPAGAQAQVDGVDTAVRDGAIAFSGALGSVHHVGLSTGRLQTTVDVTIAEDGPRPPKVELVAPPAKVSRTVSAPQPASARSPTFPPAPATTATGGLHMEMK